MNSRSGALERSLPRIARVPRQVSSDGPDACFLASAYGLTADDWQEDVLEAWMGRRKDGRWSASICGLAVPRQNGKNSAIEIRELFGMVELGEHILHTAHQIKTARKAFKRILSFFENERQYPELVELVKEIRQTNGQEAIVLTNGGSIEFVARTRSSGRGFAGIDLLVFDEAQDLDDDAVEALQPTTAAASLGNPQTIFTGTPPNPDLNQTGGVFIRIRARGSAGIDPRMCWHDYGVADGPLPDIADRAVWLQTNPGMPHRLSVAVVDTEFSMLTSEGFARERLGWWGEPGSSASDIDPRAWRECAEPTAVVDGARALGLDVTLDQGWAALSGAGQAGGVMHIQVVSHQRGTSWIVEASVELQNLYPNALLYVDERSPAASLIPDLEEAGVRIVKANTAHVTDGCAWMFTAIQDNGVTHADDEAMNKAVAGVKKRAIGDRFAWGRKQSSTDITPFNAATLAAWGLTIDARPLDDVGAWTF